MIRLRFAPDVTVPTSLPLRSGVVELTTDSTVIAAESEKNGATRATSVDQVLRPLFAGRWREHAPLFSLVSVETRAGCNHECGFCPVSRSIDPRAPGKLEMNLVCKIADELADLDFAGRVSLFGNNEPLLDTRLVEIVALFRSRLPRVDIRILTNGTLATPQLVAELFGAGLSTLTVNNYTDGERLIRPVNDLMGAGEQFAPFDIRISVRDRGEVLTTRAGLAPNKPVPAEPPTGFCALPFTDLHIAYTGDVSQCCFDAHGRVSMGSVATSRMTDIWYSPKFTSLRESLLQSRREGLTLCETCDFDGFRDPDVGGSTPLIRQDLPADLEAADG